MTNQNLPPYHTAGVFCFCFLFCVFCFQNIQQLTAQYLKIEKQLKLEQAHLTT